MNRMTRYLSNLAAALVAVALLASGVATRYNPGVMDVVVTRRIQYGQVDPAMPARGFVALLDCEHLGRQVWLEGPDRETGGRRVDGPYIVADCAAGEHRQALAERGWAADLSWEVAMAWGVIDAPLAGFMVLDGDPRLEGTPNGIRMR